MSREASSGVPDTGAILRGLTFCYPWREYQARVLKAVDSHLSDRRLHIVAAPGSGKTTLGIEVIRRLGQPALVLSPTRTIRDQWLARLAHFLPERAHLPPDWTSRSLDQPGLLTSLTYQALHTRHRLREQDTEEAEEADPDDAVATEEEVCGAAELLRAAGVKTVVLDEAHHLRAEWWKVLDRLVTALGDATLVALTATPPYDVAGQEWRRYESLCGPVDEEISVPELVRAGTLCPHQDFVWLSEVRAEDRERIAAHDRAVDRLCADLLADPAFMDRVAGHPWVHADEPDPGEILAQPELAVALLVALRAGGRELPQALLDALDVRADELPELTRRWWQVLLRAFLSDAVWPHDPESEEYRDRLAKGLRKRNLLWRRELRIDRPGPLRDLLALNPAKIDAVTRIHGIELAARGDRLRMVVLTDYIRDDDTGSGVPSATDRLGAWPVFRALSAGMPAGNRQRCALLTGRLVVLHESLADRLGELLGDAPAVEPFPALPGFVRVPVPGSRAVAAFTRLFAEGRLRTLVGTRALLGEGWDAPSINVLVLASFVGSFMLTNQMRGRAIRVDPDHPDKVATIWHLSAVCADQPSGLADIEDLERRFRTFVGPDVEAPVIESGLRRLNLAWYPEGSVCRDALDAEANNLRMAQRVAAREAVRDQWQRGIEAATSAIVVPGVRAPKPPKMERFHLRRTLRYLLMEALLAFFSVSGHVAEALGNVRVSGEGSWKVWAWLLTLIFGAGFLAVLPKLWRAFRLWLFHLPVDGSVRAIGEALRDALCASKLVDSPAQRLAVQVQVADDGSQFVALHGATFYEQALFADCIAEMLGIIENPRYLLTREGMLGRWRRIDYHAVPTLLGSHRDRADLLHESWVRRVGPARLVYTRSPEGRRELLHARGRAFSSAMADDSERMDRWQ